MVESQEDLYDIDPQEPIQVTETIKDPTDNEVDLCTKPDFIEVKPEKDLERIICPCCSYIAVDPI